ncbi:MAG: CAP domain-containing protein [Pyrinomonadaceae bacterium]
MKIANKQLIFTSLLMLALVFAANAQKVKKTGNRCPGTNGLQETEIAALLDAHNKIRADVGLSKLKWNCKLADLAQEWATRGKFEHRVNPVYGENLFVASETNALAAESVQTWLMEKSFWNNSAGTCQAGKVCVHYTQMVWRNTTEIGCGINRKASGKWQLMLVCNYNPMGNYAGKAY